MLYKSWVIFDDKIYALKKKNHANTKQWQTMQDRNLKNTRWYQTAMQEKDNPGQKNKERKGNKRKK